MHQDISTGEHYVDDLKPLNTIQPFKTTDKKMFSFPFIIIAGFTVEH